MNTPRIFSTRPHLRHSRSGVIPCSLDNICISERASTHTYFCAFWPKSINRVRILFNLCLPMFSNHFNSGQGKRRGRSRNGLEEAYDYLCIVQEAWEQPDVWAWANGRDDAKKLLLKSCAREGCTRREKKLAQFKRCGQCREVFYCTKYCQESHWPSHKPRQSVPHHYYRAMGLSRTSCRMPECRGEQAEQNERCTEAHRWTAWVRCLRSIAIIDG